MNALRKDVLWILGGMAPMLLVWVVLMLKIMEFREVYPQFGIELPTSTRLMDRYHAYACVAPLLVVAVWWLWPKPMRRNLVALSSGFVMAVLWGFLGMIALYLPIFRLGALVG